MVINMDQLQRIHYLKHYLGGPAMILREQQTITGQIEQVDIEDQSVLVKSGDRSQWVEGPHVSPSIKKFKDLSTEHIHCIVDHLIFHGKRMSSSEILSIGESQNRSFGISVLLTDNRVIWISQHWSIIGMDNIGRTPDNIGTVIFLLCELGYDVTGIF